MMLTAYRVARLLVHDEFPPVKWLREKFTGPYTLPQGDPRRGTTRVPYWLAYLWTCTWCMTVWTAGGVTLLTWLITDLPLPLLVWGAVSAGAALLSHLEDFTVRDDSEE
jgi:hypothetical protein